MNIKIRSERILDYNSIANVNYNAFLRWHPDNQYVSEPILVDILRHNSMFDPELSLVAEIDGIIAGHVLFSPYKFIVLGEEQVGAVLAPIAVSPEFQRVGIGRMLIEEGHRKARELGCAFSLLCGHVDYYPKFGYKNEMFALSGSRVNFSMENFNSEGFNDRPVNSGDIPWILESWKRQHNTASLALMPGVNICEWSNQSLHCRCSVVTGKERVLGYVRYSGSNPLAIMELLSRSEDVPDILAYLAVKRYGKAQGEIHITIPVEKLQASLSSTGNCEVFDEQTAHMPFMIRVLEQESPIASYCEKVENGIIKPGIIVFPPTFDMDDGRTE